MQNKELGEYGCFQLGYITPDDPHFEEAQYCIANGKSLLDFDSWTHFEDVTGENITYDEYAYLDSLVDEVLTEMDEQECDALLGWLRLYREGNKS